MIHDPGQIRALLSLLSDEDDRIHSAVCNKLATMGEATVRALIPAAGEGTRAHRELLRALRRTQCPTLEDRFRNLAVDEDGDIDLEAGAFLLAAFGYPDVPVHRYRARLDRMAADLVPSVAPDDHPIKVIRTVNHYLFQTQGFRGQREEPDPDNSYLNRVLDRKCGLPIALSAIYILLARRLELPVVGIDLPAQFLVQYKSPDGMDILIDPFSDGQILTRSEVADLLGRFRIEYEEGMLAEASDRRTLIRMMVNLVGTYGVLGDAKRAEELTGYIQILQPDTQ